MDTPHVTTVTYSNNGAPFACNILQAKMDRMAEEAATAQKSALEALRGIEEQVTAQELSRVNADLERDRKDAEAELKRYLHVR